MRERERKRIGVRECLQTDEIMSERLCVNRCKAYERDRESFTLRIGRYSERERERKRLSE